MRSMTPEERFERIERSIEFLAANQAQLSASLETLREVSLRHDARLDHLAEAAIQHDEQLGRLMDISPSLVRVMEKHGRRLHLFCRISVLISAQ